MTAAEYRTHPGHELFARYAFPPNELGYCGPPDVGAMPGTVGADLARYAREFDGAWPYLNALAEAAGQRDPLDEQIVRNYWVGGRLLTQLDASVLLARLREAFTGQVTGLLARMPPDGVLAHHSFHVFVVYPWIRFLEQDSITPLKVMQDCRIRWGVVDQLDDEHAVILTRPLVFDAGVLTLGAPVTERVRWCRNGASLAPAPRPGQTVSAHWDWVCETLTDADVTDLEVGTLATLALVNAARCRS